MKVAAAAVAPEPSEPTRPVWWTDSDRRTLQKAMDPLQGRWSKQPMGFLRSEGTTLLCSPSSEVYERLTTFLTHVSLVSGLVLSSIAGVALAPLHLEDYPDTHTVAEAYNVIAAITVAIQLCVVLYSTFTLYLVTATAHNPTTAYQELMHMIWWIGLLEFLTFIPAFGSFGLIILAAYLQLGSAWAFWLVLGVIIAVVGGAQSLFVLMCLDAFPYNSWAWASMAALGFPWLSRDIEAKSKTHGALLVAQAKEGVLAGLDEDGDLTIDDAAQVHAGEEALTAWVRSVLHIDGTRSALLVKELLANGLTRERMVEAAGLPGGFQVLCDLLAAQAREVVLRPGDRLALASAAMRAAASEPLP